MKHTVAVDAPQKFKPITIAFTFETIEEAEAFLNGAASDDSVSVSAHVDLHEAIQSQKNAY